MKETFKNFELFLDRTTRDKNEMIKKYKEIYENFKKFEDPNICPIVPNYIPGQSCDTSFMYIIDERGRLTAEKGMKNFY